MRDNPATETADDTVMVLNEADIAVLVEELHGYAAMEGLRPAFRALCDFTAAILESALDGEVSPELAGDAVDLWAEAAEREGNRDGANDVRLAS